MPEVARLTKYEGAIVCCFLKYKFSTFYVQWNYVLSYVLKWQGTGRKYDRLESQFVVFTGAWSTYSLFWLNHFVSWFVYSNLIQVLFYQRTAEKIGIMGIIVHGEDEENAIPVY